jgi:PAS domain S-box-containing protein
MDIKNRSKKELLSELEFLRMKLNELERNAPSDTAINPPSLKLENLDQDIDIVLFFDEKGKFQYVNELWKEKLNYQEEYLPYIRLRDTMHPKEWSSMQLIMEQLKQSNDKVKVDTIFNSKQGESIYVSGSLKMERFGDTPYYVGIFHDVTERVRANKAERLYYTIANLTLQIGSLNTLYKAIHSELSNIIDARNFYIAISDFKKNKLLFPFVIDENIGPTEYSKDRIWSNGITEYVIKKNKAIILTQDKILDLFLKQKLVLFGPLPKVFIGVPFRIENDNIGLIAMQNYEDENAYSKRDLELLNFISGQIALAIARKQNEEKIRSQAARLNAIFESSTHVIWSVDREYRITSFNVNFLKEVNRFYAGKKLDENNDNLRSVLKQIPDEIVFLWKQKYDEVFEGNHL